MAPVFSSSPPWACWFCTGGTGATWPPPQDGQDPAERQPGKLDKPTNSNPSQRRSAIGHSFREIDSHGDVIGLC